MHAENTRKHSNDSQQPNSCWDADELVRDNPTRVSVGQDWRDSDISHRIPIIVTGNDLSTIYAPLIRDGRMDKFYWQPTHEDITNIVCKMYEKDGISREAVVNVVDSFPNQALDFYGALRSRTYD